MDIIAHRGASAHAPENTLAAFHLAWEQGADGIEMDVHLSRDGRVMVHHDLNTRRSAGVDLRIATTDSETLRQLDVGKWKGEEFVGERMPFLEEALATVPFRGRVLIELKCGADIVPALRKALAVAPCEQRLAFISFHVGPLYACRLALPEVPCYLVSACSETDAWGGRICSPKLIEIALNHDFAGLDPDHRGVTADFAVAVRAAGLGLIAWTVNDPLEACRLRDLELEAVATDWPAEIRQILDLASG